MPKTTKNNIKRACLRACLDDMTFGLDRMQSAHIFTKRLFLVTIVILGKEPNFFFQTDTKNPPFWMQIQKNQTRKKHQTYESETPWISPPLLDFDCIQKVPNNHDTTTIETRQKSYQRLNSIFLSKPQLHKS